MNFNAVTSVGAREKNQDVVFADGFLSSPEITDEQRFVGEVCADGKLHVFAVCDGIGMYSDSGLAAEAALQAIKEKQNAFNEGVNDCSIDSLRKWAEDALLYARDSMLQYCNEKHTRGSATIVFLAILNENYVMVNTGDSPAFLLENGEITELSVRHNMATLKRLLGVIPVEAEERILLHHLGESVLNYEEKYGTLGVNGVFVICTDGISSAIGEGLMLKMLNDGENASSLVSYASGVPEADNCSLILIGFIQESA